MLLNIIIDLIFVINETWSKFCKLGIAYNILRICIHISKTGPSMQVCAKTKNLQQMLGYEKY